MKVIKTVPSDLHTRVQESMRKRIRGLTPEEFRQKEFQRSREAFLQRVHQELGKNFIKEEK